MIGEMEFNKRCDILERGLEHSGDRIRLAQLHNDMLERIKELEKALADTERMWREEKEKNRNIE